MDGEPVRGVHRAWVFTWNNPPPDWQQFIIALKEDLPHVVAYRETGASGTPHIQGYLVLRVSRRLDGVRGLLPFGLHWEPRHGPESRAQAYCRKDGNADHIDYDDRRPGRRSDLAEVAEIIAKNPRTGPREVAIAFPERFIKFHAGISALARAIVPVSGLIVQRNVYWHFGATGCGKTYTAITQAQALADDISNIFIWSIKNFKFAGSYAGEEFVIFEELRTTWEHFSFGGLLTLLDSYRAEVEVKGGVVPWNAKHIWITTPLHPREFITDEERRGNPLCWRQLTRRLKEVREFNVPYEAEDDPVEVEAQRSRPGTPPLVAPRPVPAALGVPCGAEVSSDDEFVLRGGCSQALRGDL